MTRHEAAPPAEEGLPATPTTTRSRQSAAKFTDTASNTCGNTARNTCINNTFVELEEIPHPTLNSKKITQG